MAIVDKTDQRFDEVTKADRLGLINALIHASTNFDTYKPNLKLISRELNTIEKFIFRLLPTLELYRREGRLSTFGEKYEDGLITLDGESLTEESLKKFKKKVNSLKTPGGEMGIWIDGQYSLSTFALKVANNEITTRRYISVVFLNLFSFFKNESTNEYEYKHLLLEILRYFNVNGLDKIYPKEILIDIFKFTEEKDSTKINNQKNILCDYLISTEFFVMKKNNEGKDGLYLKSKWQEKIDQLMAICNLKYENATLEQVKKELNRDNDETKLAYSEYISSNYKLYEKLVFDFTVEQTSQFTNNAKLKQGDTGINRIFFGAPGTGKSYNIKSFIKKHGIENYSDKENHPNVFRTTLHPDFSYLDFVGQVMPVVSESGSISYQFEPKIFTKALIEAFKKENFRKKPVFLILEEMSRANVAAVFGDLFQLLDRDENGESEYRINNNLISLEISKHAYDVFGDFSNKIYIPSNLFIIGTVNTSDQNVFVMDTAFKRRFEFEYLPTKIQPQLESKNNYLFKFENPSISFTWVQLLNTLNSYIVAPVEKGGLGLKEDKQLGQFFIKFKKAHLNEQTQLTKIEEYNKNQISGKLIHYLWNDVEKVSYSNTKIFREDILHFGELYERTIEGSNIFSQEFLELLKVNGATFN